MGSRATVVNTQGTNSVTTLGDDKHKVTVIGYGIKGDKGEPGANGQGSDKNYEHIQAIPASVWNIVHNLGKNPSVSVVDSTGSLVDGDVKYLDVNIVQVSFVAGFSGRAFLN